MSATFPPTHASADRIDDAPAASTKTDSKNPLNVEPGPESQAALARNARADLSTDSEKADQELAAYPDGGLQAWSVVAGAWCVSFATWVRLCRNFFLVIC